MLPGNVTSKYRKAEEHILVVDDDEIIRMYLESLLIDSGYRVTTATNFSAVKHLLIRHAFELIIADLQFLGKSYSGLDIVKHTLSVYPKCKAIILTSYPSTDTAVAALRLNAIDYLFKPASRTDVLYAVSRAFSCCGNDGMERASLSASLSAREIELLVYLFKGYNFNEIAKNMDCSLATAKTYSRRIYKKLGVNSRAEAVHEAIRNGLIAHS